MNDTPEKDPLAPDLNDRDRKFFERAVRELQTHSVIADFEGDDQEATDLFQWAEKHQNLLEAYFSLAGLGVRAHVGIPVIQLVLEDDGESHPLRHRFSKTDTSLLICLWILYHERAHEVEGFIIPVSVEDIYARLSALYSSDKVLPKGNFEEAIQRFTRYRLVQVDWEPDDFEQSRVMLLPTLMTTFHFADPAEAINSVTPKPAKP